MRAYAREVGLDPEETVRRFVEAFPPETEEQAPAAASHAIDAETYESGRRAVKILLRVVGVVIVGLAAALVYWKLRATPTAVPPPVADPPAVAQPAPVPAAPVPTGPGTETSAAPEVHAATPPPAAGTQAPATGGPEPAAIAPSVPAGAGRVIGRSR